MQEAQSRLLIVEDDEHQQAFISQLLELHPFARDAFAPTIVATLAEALAQLEDHTFDVVLLDLTLPDSSGIETFHSLRRQHPDVAIVIWSAQSDESLALRALREGAQEYLPKADIQPSQLVRALRHIVERVRMGAELRRTQQELLHAQKLEAVGRLAGGVAHDFNNLLTVIGGHADLLVDLFKNNPEAHAEIDEIRRGVDRAAALTRQLLTFSRKGVTQLVTLDLRTVITEMRKLLARLIGEDIEIITQTNDVPALIRADRGQIEQVVVNLVVNSRDAMPHGGRITIATDLLDVTTSSPHASGATDGAYVRLTVADTGTGMNSEVLAHIFEPFYTTKEVGKGTGLGLATVYGIMKQGGGFISLTTAPDAGTTFELLFPRDVEAHAAPQLPIRGPREGKQTGTVLVVEDDVSVREVVCRVLQRAGYKVMTASNGEEGLRLAERELDRIDLILTDVIMPRLHGPDMVDRLRAKRPDVRVLFTSGYTANALRADLSSVNFLEKPFTASALVAAVHRALSARAA